MQALQCISLIELRPYPLDVDPVTFHRSFESDAARVKRFCKKSEVFDRNSRSIETRWDVVLLLSKDHFLYYLPAIMRAVIEYPTGPLATAMTSSRFRSERCKLSDVELAAVQAVQAYLACRGVTYESVRAATQRGKAIAKQWMEHQTLDDL